MTAMTADAAPSTAVQVIAPNSYAQETYFRSTAPVRLFSSRVGRGKSWSAVAHDYVKACALPGIQIAMTRLERASMENTTMETMRKIIPPSIWAKGWSESKGCLSLPPVRCSDGKHRVSRIWCFGWLDPGRALSAEFGSITVDQAEQLDYRHYTTAQTRLRQNDPWINERAESMGLAPRQMSLICNPEDNEHWIAKEFDPEAGMRVIRDAGGRVVAEVILSGFHDNEGNLPADYRERLESLRGTVYYDRLVLGRWARAEGLVFPMYDPAQHLVPVPESWAQWNGYPPPDWLRYRGIDFGYRNPFVCLWVARSPEGVDHVYREWSMGERLVEDHAKIILEHEATELAALRAAPALSGDAEQAFRYRPYLNNLRVEDAFADHDAEDAATLARHGVRTRPARKGIDACIKAIAGALNRGTLKIVNTSLIAEDRTQANMKLPTSLARELSGYRWQKMVEAAKNPKDASREKPIDAMNHRIDALGYILHSLETTPRPSAWVAS
jgi:phage terminase large subunit